VQFLGSSQQNFCSDSDCGYQYFRTRQKIYKIYQFCGYQEQLRMLEEKGKAYELKEVKENEFEEQ
jgi:hypothetical protein